MIDASDWDFEGLVSFLSPEEGGLARLPAMGYFPSFRYPEFEDATQFMARPVLIFGPDGTPYDPGQQIASPVVFRFYFPDRELYETVHRLRLVPRRGFELMEGSRTVARGEILERKERMPKVEADIERLAVDLRDAISNDDVKEIFAFVYHREWECAMHHLWAVIGTSGIVLAPDAYARIVEVGQSAGLDVEAMRKELPIRVASV